MFALPDKRWIKRFFNLSIKNKNMKKKLSKRISAENVFGKKKQFGHWPKSFDEMRGVVFLGPAGGEASLDTHGLRP